MPNAYEVQIQSACGCDADEAIRIENVMREFVFHSTLDWFSAAQFRAAARKVHRLYQTEKAMFDDYFGGVKAQFQKDRQAQAQS